MTRFVAIVRAFQKYIQRCKQQKIIALFGTLDYQKDYDYKKLRARPTKRK